MHARNWKEVKIDEGSQSPADDLAAYIQSHVTTSGEYNLLYQYKKQESMLHIIVRDSGVTCYVADLDGRAVTKPLQEGAIKGITEVFHEAPTFVDVTGEKRRQELFAALAKGGIAVPNYQDTHGRMSPETALENIIEYRAAQTLRRAVQPAQPAPKPSVLVTPKEASALQENSLWRVVKNAIRHTPAVEHNPKDDKSDEPKFRK
jgi:hypothetical protein